MVKEEAVNTDDGMIVIKPMSRIEYFEVKIFEMKK